MSFQPVIPFGGFAGWAFLNRTLERQQDALIATPTIRRQEEYFASNISKVTSASDLVSDRRLLQVSLRAFGLEEDIENRAFIQRVLEGGSLKEDSLANKLSDKRYLELTKAFGFGDFSTPRTQLSDFSQEILDRFRQKTFVAAIGDQNPDLRLALDFQSEIGEIANLDTESDLAWYKILGSKPMRQVVEVALGVPVGLGAGDLDQQLRLYKERMRQVLGSDDLTQFTNKEKVDRLVQIFLARAELGDISTVSNSRNVALTLLQNTI